jgi:phosphoglycolate phosphatase
MPFIPSIHYPLVFMVRLVIFDMDNTLLRLGVDWPSVKVEVLKLAEKKGLKVDASQHLVLLAVSVSSTPVLKKEVDAIFKKYEGECIENGAYEFFPEMIRLVKEFHAAGYVLAIASGNMTKTIKDVLSVAGVADSFDVLCGRECTKTNKPDPDQLFFILRKLKIDAKDALFIGDSPYDEEAAKRAGVRCIRVARPYSPENAERLRKLLLKTKPAS